MELCEVQWCVAISHDGKKKVYYDIQHGSTICCNGHVVTSVTRVVHQVVLFIEIVITYHLLYYIYSIYIYLLLPRVHSVQKNTEIPAFIEPITKKQNRAENTFGTMKKMIIWFARSCWILPTWKKLDTLLQHMYLHASWRRCILWMYALI